MATQESEVPSYITDQPWTKNSRFYRAGYTLTILSTALVVLSFFVGDDPTLTGKTLDLWLATTSLFLLGAGGRSVAERVANKP